MNAPLINKKNSKDNVVGAWLLDLEEVLGGESIDVREVRIGVFYTAVRLSSGFVGVAFTPRGFADEVCCPSSASGAPAAGRLAGQEALSLARYALSPVPLKRSVGVAVLNALSAQAMAKSGIPGGKLMLGVDALQSAEIRPDDRVVLVGSFVPFIKSLKGRVAKLWIVDKHKEALKPEELTFWKPPEQAADVVSRASVAIITGSALVEGGIDSLLEAAQKARRVVLAGPTASPWPPPFFDRGVHVLGGIRILDGEAILQTVSEGGSGYFFEGAAEKACIVCNQNKSQEG